MSRSWLLALAATLLAACGPRRAPRRPGDEYLKGIVIEGNRQLSDKALTTGLALLRGKKRGRSPDPYLIQVDAERIRGEYLRQGFFAVEVRSRVERSGDAATVVYTVHEGTRAPTRVVIEGLPADPDLSIAKVRAQLPLRDGQPFDYAVYDAAKPMVLGAVTNAGYAHAKLEATIYADRTNHEAVVELRFDPGPKARFGQVEITGVEGALAEAVRARLQFSEGERYSTRAITATQRRLYAMARFSTVQVQVEPDPSRAPVVKVKVAVSEAARREIRLGGGFGMDPTAYEVRGRLGYTIVGWPRPLDTATFDLRPAYAYLRDAGTWQPRIRALGKLERQDLLWTYSSGELSAAYNYLAVEAYTSYGPRGRIGFGTPIDHRQRIQLRLGWSLEYLSFRDISPVLGPELRATLGLDEAQRVGAFSQAITADLRDNPIEPRIGVYGELRVVEGTVAAGGAFDYVQLIPELRGYVPLGRVVLAARARTGLFFGDAPVTERFFSGGASNHRGFGERKLSPSVTGLVGDDERTVPYGGTAMVETSLEARIPIATWREIPIGAVAFLDGGDVTNGIEQLDLLNLYWAVGLGLRFHTIVGPVRVDLGYRINRTGPTDLWPDEKLAFHFSLGEAF